MVNELRYRVKCCGCSTVQNAVLTNANKLRKSEISISQKEDEKGCFLENRQF